MSSTKQSQAPVLPVTILAGTGDPTAALSYATNAAPTSSAVSNANQLQLHPVYLPEPFTVAKAFWCNGGTVGTDSIDVGIYQMTNLSTGRCDLVRSTGAILSAGTASAVQEVAAWKVARTLIDSGANTTDAASWATNSVTFKCGRLYALSFTNTKASTPDVASAVTLTSATTAWTSVATQAFNTVATPTQRLTVYSFVPTKDYTDTITVVFGGVTQTGLSWSVVERSGVDTTTTNGIVQSAIGTTDSGTTATATLGAFGSANNATYGVASVNNASAMTAGTGFTQLATVTYGTPNTRMADQWRVDNQTAVAETWTSGAAAIIGLEIKADASAFVIPPYESNLPTYMAITVSGTAATFLRASPGVGYAAAAGALVVASTFPLPSTIAATTGVATNILRILFGFSLRSLIG